MGGASGAEAAPHTGTTIVAVSYDGGVVIGADSRVSTGAQPAVQAPLGAALWTYFCCCCNVQISQRCCEAGARLLASGARTVRGLLLQTPVQPHSKIAQDARQ